MSIKYRHCQRRKNSSQRHQRSSWKIFQLDNRVKKRLRLLGLAVLVLASTALTFASLALYNYLKKPLVAAADGGVVFEQGWDGRARLNLLLLKLGPSDRAEALAVLTLDPSDPSLTILELPLAAVGEEGSSTEPLKSLPRAVASFLGIPLDGYFLVDPTGEAQLLKILGGPLTVENAQKLVSLWGLPKIPAAMKELGENVKTNLSLLDLLQMARSFSALRFDKIRQLSFFSSESGLSDPFLKETFSEEALVEEGAKILVLNGTRRPGLAAAAARLITHLGGFVLDTANAAQADYAQSLLVTDNSSYTAKRLAKIFKISQYREKSAFAQGPLFGYIQRADVVLILGLDNADRL